MVKWFNIFFWAKIFFLHYLNDYFKFTFGKSLSFLEIWFLSLFSASGGFLPSKQVNPFGLTFLYLENLKLRNWCFYCVKILSILFLMKLRCICNRSVRSRQEYIKCFQLLTFSFWKPTDLRSWKVTLKYF